MKKLESISVTRLTNLEFGQHVKSVKNNLNLLGNGTLITDAILKDYINKLDEQSGKYDGAMVQVFKSDETAKIEAADVARDKALSSLLRYLNVFELAEAPEEVLAFTSLKTLFNTYGNIQNMNFEKETNAIDNIVIDLGNDHYKPHVILLNMSVYVERLTSANTNFKTLFEGRTQETASREVFDVKTMRQDLKAVYEDMNDYVLSMSKAVNSDEFNQSLDVINTVRTYYGNLLAKRKPAKKGEVEETIPPMET